MKVLIFERDLIWTTRLRNNLVGLGHEAISVRAIGEETSEADVAIVNLGSNAFPLEQLVPELHTKGIKVIAHAGHKEKDLHELGRSLGCDRLATNSELTHKLEQILGSL